MTVADFETRIKATHRDLLPYLMAVVIETAWAKKAYPTRAKLESAVIEIVESATGPPMKFRERKDSSQ